MDLPRKIQLTGRNTYIVSLPHEWVSRQGVGKGSALYVKDNGDGSLTLSPKEGKKELKSVSIEVSKATRDIAMRNIVAAYVGGAGTITLTGQGMSTIAEEARRVLSGVEITDESKGSLTLRVLAFEDINIDGIIKRAYNVTNAMFDLAESAFSEGGHDIRVEMSRKEDDVDRLYLLLLRTMFIEGFPGKAGVFKLIAAKSIEKVGDHLLDIVESSEGLAPNETMAELLQGASRMYSAAFQVLSSNELDRGDFSDARRQFAAQLDKADGEVGKEKDVERMLAMKAMLEKFGKLQRYSEDMMESATDMYFAALEGPQRPAGGD